MRFLPSALILVLLFFSPACKPKPIPPEVKEAENQADDLWRVGAHLYTVKDYEAYKKLIQDAKNLLIKEKGKFVWFRKYDKTQEAFRKALDEGRRILEQTKVQKEIRLRTISTRIESHRRKVDSLKRLSRMLNEGRFARLILMRVELKLSEAALNHQRGNILDAEKILTDVDLYVKDIENFIYAALDRYQDESLIAKWRSWKEETLEKSRKENIIVAIITKIERTLSLYKDGNHLESFPVALGKNGLLDKVHVGDYATPEGKYKIIKKIRTSQYFKALLLDYPNQEDREKFALNKKMGIIPPGIEIGGLIEIHGGGSETFTDGCIALNDSDMERLYELVEVGTPVTIIGSTEKMKNQFTP